MKTKDINKDITVSFRISKEIKNMLEFIASNDKIKLSEYLRDMCIKNYELNIPHMLSCEKCKERYKAMFKKSFTHTEKHSLQ